MRALAHRVDDAMPYALFVFSDANTGRWWFAFRVRTADVDDLRHIEAGPLGERPSRVAALLARLRTFTADGRERSLAAILNSCDRVFGGRRGGFARGRRTREDEDPYWKDVRRYPILDSVAERELAMKLDRLKPLRHTDRAAAREFQSSRNELVCANLRLSAHFSMRLLPFRRLETLDVSDLIQEGNIGLIRAAQLFDVEYGTRFSTYAVRAIKTALSRAIVVLDPVLRQPLTREHKPARLARCVIDISERHDLAEHRYAGPEAALIRQEACQSVRNAITQLRPVQRFVVLGRFGLAGDGHAATPASSRFRFDKLDGNELTLDAVSEMLRLSKERVRQIEKSALERLRFFLNADGTPSGREVKNANTRHN